MDIASIKPNQQKALFLAKKQLSELVCDAVNLEGINFTLPEVQTLLDGVTIGGHKLSDQTITLNQSQAWQWLFHKVENNGFNLSKDFVCELHRIAADSEALTWGEFRNGQVTISGTDYRPPEANKLDTIWQELIATTFTSLRPAVEMPQENNGAYNNPDHSNTYSQITNIAPDDDDLSAENIYNQAIYLFLQMARNQFFFDVNKRMGRFMMNGILLAHGYPAINLPAKRQLEFNELMLDFYPSGDVAPMTAFMKSCLSEETINIMNN